MVRWGLLGTSFVADRYLAPALREAGHDLAVVGSRSLSRAQAFAAGAGVRRARAGYEDVVEADDVDAVYVGVPNALREEWVLAALQAGKHVLVERPLALDAAAAGRLAAASASARRLLMEAQPLWFHPRTAALLDTLRSSVIGDLRLVTVTNAGRVREPASWRMSLTLGGGALLDAGVPAVALCRWAARAEPDGVRAVQRRWATGADASTAALLAFSTGVSATIHASLDAAPVDSAELVGTSGTVSVPRAFTAWHDEEVDLLVDGKRVGSWRADPYERMVVAFAEAAARGADAPLPIDDAVATSQVLDRLRTAAI
jgi:D-xylose 1-dehydrogenase (NADP+, D-xylono-1,5-lactone-forming)